MKPLALGKEGIKKLLAIPVAAGKIEALRNVTPLRETCRTIIEMI